MKRRVIEIDEEKCIGCGICAEACHESAIAIVDGKAKLMRDDYCDGLGDCLPTCPTGAIAFVEREAAAYDEAAVLKNKERLLQEAVAAASSFHGCPGSQAREIVHAPGARRIEASEGAASCLRQWPVQIQLAAENAAYFSGADLLVAADCTAYAYASFHEDFIKGRITLIGCPKLDDADYAGKLTEIFRQNEIRSVTVARMEVPCCGGLEYAVETALQNSGKNLPYRVVIISTDGQILEQY